MRYGVIADVHANAHALDAALAFLATQELDGYLCAGDLVGYGPLPNECVRRVLALPGRCVAGNHDLIALGRLSDERCIPLAQASLRWTRGVLEDDVRALLAGLPLGVTVDGIALRHGSIADPQEYVVTMRQAGACLEQLAAYRQSLGLSVPDPDARVFGQAGEMWTTLEGIGITSQDTESGSGVWFELPRSGESNGESDNSAVA